VDGQTCWRRSPFSVGTGAMKWPSGSPTFSSLRSFIAIQPGSITRMSSDSKRARPSSALG
jgi:hypothetical protein